LVDGKSSGRGHAVGALVGDVVDFSTTGGDAEIGREPCERGLGGGIEGGRTGLGL
jgi:hypothetical protein